jgi:hypothetical protein
MAIRIVDILQTFDDPATAAVLLAPEIANKAEKERKQKAQRRGTADRKPRPSTGNPVGRPMLGLNELLAA